MAEDQFACDKHGPPGPLEYWKCRWEEKDLGAEHDFELKGMELIRLLRLRPDCKDKEGWFPESRVEYMSIAAREALGMGNCEIVGGFIRDWIIRGEIDQINKTPKDIDLRLWKGFDLLAFVKRCERWSLKREDRDSVLGFLTPKGDWFFIDFIWTEHFQQGGDLSIDLDVNSLAVSCDRGLHKRAYFNRPLCKTYGNIKRKVAYLVENDPKDGRCEYMKKRVKKMEGRGWKIIRATSLHENCACKN